MLINLIIALVSAVVVILPIFFVIDHITAEETQCTHSHFSEYQSHKKRVCIDCGYSESIDATYPQHQR